MWISSAGPIISAPAACSAKSPVNAPADLAGKRIRTLPNKIITECVRLMGAAATPLAFGEIYTALQAGVLDGLEHDPPTIVASKFYETAKFYSLTEHNFSALGVFCSGSTLTKMDPPLRDQFLAAAAEAAADTRVRGLEAEKEALDLLKQKGVEIIACDREPFRKLRAPQSDEFIKAHPEAKASSISSAAPRRDWVRRAAPTAGPTAVLPPRLRSAVSAPGSPSCSRSSMRSPRSCWRPISSSCRCRSSIATFWRRRSSGPTTWRAVSWWR